MKTFKKILLSLFALVIVFTLFMINVNNVKAEGIVTSDQLQVEGAGIRTTGNAGLRFIGTVGNYDTTNVKAYGIAIAYGDAELNADFVVGGTVNGKDVLSDEDTALDKDGHYFVVLYNVPEDQYMQNVTARAYVILNNNSKVYGTTVTTRSLGYVALSAANDGEIVDGNLVDQAMAALEEDYKGYYAMPNKKFYIGSPLYEYKLNALAELFIEDWNAFVSEEDSVASISSKTKATAKGLAYKGKTGADFYYSAKGTKWTDIGNGGEGSVTNISSSNLYQFFNDSEMKAKWTWLLDVFYTVDNTHVRRQINAVKSTTGSYTDSYGSALYSCQHLLITFVNFFNTSSVAYYFNGLTYSGSSTQYTLIPQYNTTVYANSKYLQMAKVGSIIKLPAAVSVDNGYSFTGWVLNDTTYLAQSDYEVSATNVVFEVGKTPINYTLTYDLQEGSSTANTDVVNYNIETATFSLPGKDTMNKDGYNFVEWNSQADGLGSTMTEIAKGSTGNKVAYAIWQSQAPTVMELSTNDAATITSVNPTKFVSPLFKQGKYSINSTVYEVGGGQLFSTIAAAVSAASANDVIFAFEGTYSDALTISTAGLKLYGPNHNVLGKATRNSAANITGITTLASTGMTISGFEFTKIIKVNANQVTIDYCKIECTPNTACCGNNRMGCIIDGTSAGAVDLTIKNSYIKAIASSGSYQSELLSFSNLKNLKLENNYLTNTCTSFGTACEGIRVYFMAGSIDMINNEFRFATNNWLFYINGGNNNPITTINITGNIFGGRDSLTTCTLGFLNLKSTSTLNIYNNQFYNVDPSTISTGSASSTSCHVNIEYNYFDTQKAAKIYSTGITITNHNCYAGGTVTSGTNIINIDNDTVKYTTLAQVQAAYAEYLLN